MNARIEKAIAKATGRAARILGSAPQTGGLINRASIITLADGRRYFLKTNPRAGRYPDMFAAEFRALELLRATATIRVPEPLCVAADFIVLEAFTAGSRGPRWQVAMGEQLASLHGATQGEHMGMQFDNYIGTTRQANGPCADWISFWRVRRLDAQLALCARSVDPADPLLRLGRELSARLDDILAAPDESFVLLHGDLWSGNAAADERGRPVIFDPACYYGRREAELAMMALFGGFDADCFDAYTNVWPLAEGHERRMAVYRLYHELNHLNLFGRPYYDACLSTLRRLL